MNTGERIPAQKFLRQMLEAWFLYTLLLIMAACSPSPTATLTEITTSPLPSASLPIPTSSPTATSTASLDGRGGGVIAFASFETNEWQIYLLNADGSGKKCLTSGVRGGYEPSWSPDGTDLVFQYYGLWIVDITTADINRIAIGEGDVSLPNEYVVKPSWSPNGDWIAFLNESGFQGDLFLVRPDGSDLSRLTYSNDISRDGNLVWSPDGSRIGFSALQDGRIEIFTLEVERALHGQSSIRQLTDSSGLSHNLITSWSPDGSRIAFSSDREGNAEIYLMDIDSSNIVRLTDNPFSDTAPGFSPDGSQIVFLSNRYKGDIEIFVMDVAEAIQDPANAIVRRLTDHKGEEAGSVWKPAGRP